jgi:hypothetical protein
MLTPKQASLQFGISPSLVYEWCRKKLLTHYRLGVNGKGKIMIAEEDLAGHIDSMKVVANVPENPPIILKHIASRRQSRG